MTQERLVSIPLQTTPTLNKPYSKGPYNKSNNSEQWIRITEGCPNNCEYCRETTENGTEPIYYEIPIIHKNQVKILDMNLIAKPRATEIIEQLGSLKANNKTIYYELICGIDHRYLTTEIATTLYKAHFIKPRIAWDHTFGQQKQIRKAVKYLVEAGYKPEDIMIFIICNHKITYNECCKKLDLLKIWNVKACDCYFDNQTSPNIKPIHWTQEQIRNYRKQCRKHNQYIRFKIDPEWETRKKI